MTDSIRRRPHATMPEESDKGSFLSRLKTRQGLLTAGAATMVVALIAAAMVFAIAKGTTETAEEGTAGILAEASLSAAATARNSTVQALVIAEALDLGVATPAELETSLGNVAAATTELQTRIERFTGALENPSLIGQVKAETTAFISVVNLTVEQIQAGRTERSTQIVGNSLDESYQTLAATLVDRRDSAIGFIALAGEDAGRLADAARFLVLLLVPVTVLLAYRLRVRRDQRRRDLEHQMEKQRVVSETQDEFIASLSHVLRTPLTAIYGFSLELIEPTGTNDPALTRELATFIAAESSDLSRMVEDILTAAAADTDSLLIATEATDPVAEVRAVLAPMSAVGQDIETSMQGATITADPFRFRQIIGNLVSNAVHHGGPNRSIIGKREGLRYTIEVRDDGPGVPKELEDRLFSRFVHQGEDPLLTGTVGLGLAVAQLLTTHSGGTISHRREGRETVFAITFPLAVDTLPSVLDGQGAVSQA
ncbi:MAG: HAMP domain-containing sensor histidine kinase [Acidimicrobiia bacterium]|nr:HAMP domain-containing sensor histidine kinase [Acidimicrobiia bacterium]